MTTVTICVVDPDAAFVTAINGSASLDVLKEAEQDFVDNFPRDEIPEGAVDAIATLEWEIAECGGGPFFEIVRFTKQRMPKEDSE